MFRSAKNFRLLIHCVLGRKAKRTRHAEKMYTYRTPTRLLLPYPTVVQLALLLRFYLRPTLQNLKKQAEFTML